MGWRHHGQLRAHHASIATNQLLANHLKQFPYVVFVDNALLVTLI
jgi:hypothetical protein